MAGKKTTAQELIDGISNRTGELQKFTNRELVKQQQKLDDLFKKTGVETLFAGIERDVKAAGNAAQSITDPKKFKANIFDKLWLSFQTEFPKFIKNTAAKFEPITKPVSNAVEALGKTFDKKIVKPILSPLADRFKAVVKAIDSGLNKVISGPLKFIADKVNGIVKPLSDFLPGAKNLVKKLLPFVTLFTKVLPIVSLFFDLMSAQTLNTILETIQRQVGNLYERFGDLRLIQAQQTVAINKILASVGGGKSSVSISDADRQAITNAVIAGLRPLISGNKTDLSGVNGQLSKISGQVSAIPKPTVDLSGVNSKLAQISGQVSAIPKPTVDLSGVNSKLAQISGQVSAIPKPTVDLSSLTAQIRAVGNQVSAIPAPTVDFTRVNDRLTQISGQVSAISAPKLDLSSVTAQLNQINGQVSRIPTARVDLSGVNSQLANIASAQNAIGAAALSAAVLNSLRPLIQQNTAGISEVNANVARVDAKLRSPLMAIDPEVRAAAARIEQRVTSSGQVINAVDDKLGAKITNGGLSGKIERIGKIMQFDRIINMLTLITVLHNASMLASSLGQTLGSLTSEALAVVGIKDEEGSAININAILSKQADAFIISIIGAEAWGGVKTNWNKANRVISSATNVIWTVRSMADSTRNVLEWTAENTGKIGNALKKARVVPENSYPWMAENVNAQSSWHRAVDKFSQGVGAIDDTASSLASVVGEVRSVQSEFGELKTQKDEFKAAVTAATPKSAADNVPVKTDAAAVKTVSKVAPEITKPDREEGNGTAE